MSRPSLELLLPNAINTGPWVAGYALPALKQRVAAERVVLPIASLATPAAELAALGGLVLPPLYREAFAADAGLAAELVAQIRRCFPFFAGTKAAAEFRGRIEVVELPPRALAWPGPRPRVLAFGVDTTVEQHGPHLPLATDTIQTYAVLRQLAREFEGFHMAPPLEYGHLTWGLPFGMSVDVTPPLLHRYARGFIDALVDWAAPEAVYVADVHGSLVHRETIQAALRESRAPRGTFRWLHDPLAEFGAGRGDMHAGGVETTLVAHIDPALVDARWWPGRLEELAAGEMSVTEAVRLSAQLPAFIARVETQAPNGIIGRIANGSTLDGAELFRRMLQVAREDVAALRR